MANLKDLIVTGSARILGNLYADNIIGGGYHPPLLSCMWSDHTLSDISWLRADTFSWQSGTTYKTVYDELDAQLTASTDSWHTDTSGILIKTTPKGYIIADKDEEQKVLNKYNTDGIAWYYILDRTNKRFKLPRTKFGFEGLRTNVGYDITESLPNIKGYLDIFTSQGTQQNGALSKSIGSARNAGSGGELGWGTLSLDANGSSNVYQDDAPVQERATQMYLYFYAGEYSRSAIEQTAGLNAEMFNSKQDVCTHIIKTFVDGASGYRIWSDGYCEQWGITGVIADYATTTVTLLKTYRDINYNIIKGTAMPSSGDDSAYNDSSCIRWATRTTNTFQIYNRGASDGGRYVFWKTSGYLASGQY